MLSDILTLPFIVENLNKITCIQKIRTLVTFKETYSKGSKNQLSYKKKHLHI